MKKQCSTLEGHLQAARILVYHVLNSCIAIKSSCSFRAF
eukprot:UN15606